MKLKSFRVNDFRSVRDSGVVEVCDVTCLVGKNESGKTALLQALYNLNPINPDDGTFNPVDDYPRADVDDYQFDVENGNRAPARVVEAVFELEDNDIEDLTNDYSESILKSRDLTLSKGYDNVLYFTIQIDEEKFVSCIIEDDLSVETAKNAMGCKTIKDLKGFLQKEGASENQESIAKLKSTVANIEKEGGISKHFFQLYIRQFVPKFLYFDEYYQMRGSDNLTTLKARRDNRTLNKEDLPLLGLLQHARIDLDKAITATDTQDLKNRLEGAGNRITRTLLKYWSQNKHLQIRFDVREAKQNDPENMRTGINIWAEIYDSKHLATTPMGRRSRGFVWFFSFLAYFGQQKADHNTPLILLLDEPGLSLHAMAQTDLLKYIEEQLKPDNQVIYSTHSPFMVDPTHFDRVRLVQDDSMDKDNVVDPENDGTRVSNDVLSVNNDTLFPLQGAFGYEIHQTLFIGPNVLIVEGVSDLLYLQTMSALLEKKGKKSLSSKWVITPAGGAGKIAMFVSLLGSQKKMNIATLMDIDSETDSVATHLIKQKLLKKKNLLTCADYVAADEADIEDLFERDFFIELVNKEFGKNIKPEDVKGTISRVLIALLPAFGNKDINHFRPARYLAERLNELESKISDDVLNRFEKLFVDLNRLL